MHSSICRISDTTGGRNSRPRFPRHAAAATTSLTGTGGRPAEKQKTRETERASREKKIDGRWKSKRKLLAQQSRSCLPSFSFPPSPNSQLVEAMMEQGIKPRALGRAGGGARSWLAWPWPAFPRSDGDSFRPGRSQITPGSDRHRHHGCSHGNCS